MIKMITYRKELQRATVELAHEFYNKNQYTKGVGHLNQVAFSNLLDVAVDSSSDVFVRLFVDTKTNTVVGFFVGLCFENKLFNLTLAHEQGFYSRVPLGLKLSREVVTEFENWGAEGAAQFAVLSCLAGTKVHKLYERLGYEHSESAYTKRISE